ncbi:MAG: hypothetical protein ABJC79_09010, partial [Acidimicrobiia bacterium]
MLGILVVLVGACDGAGRGSGEGAIDRAHGIPIRASELQQSGTPLGDGFSVPRGAVLAGAVLPEVPDASPARGTPVVHRGWTAVLGVGGAPRAVAERLLAQARAAGLPSLPHDPYCDRSGCGFASGLGHTVFGQPTLNSGRFVTVEVVSQPEA